MRPVSTHAPVPSQVAFGKLLWVGPLAIGVATLADLLVRTLAVAFFGVTESFIYLQAPFMMSSIIIFGVLATLTFALIGRLARRPVRLFQIIASLALLLSFLNPILALFGQFPVVGMNLHIFWTMIVMHCVAALLLVSLLSRLALRATIEQEAEVLKQS